MANETDRKLDDFRRASQPIVELLRAGEFLTGTQENDLVDTIHVLQVAYNEWLVRTPVKDQSYPPDEER